MTVIQILPIARHRIFCEKRHTMLTALMTSLALAATVAQDANRAGAAAPLPPGDWRYFGHASDKRKYMFANIAERITDKNSPSIWIYTVNQGNEIYAEEYHAKATAIHYRLDCAGNEFSLLSTTFYDAAGAVLFSKAYQNAVAPVRPGTVSELVEAAACKTIAIRNKPPKDAPYLDSSKLIGLADQMHEGRIDLHRP